MSKLLESVSPEDLKEIRAFASALASEMKQTKEKASVFADETHMRFPLDEKKYIVGSGLLYKKSPEKIRGQYSDSEWKLIGEKIDAKLKEVGVSLADHDEEADIEMCLQAITLVRSLLANEATDGDPEDTWELYFLLQTLEMLSEVLWEEKWDVTVEQMEADASTEAPENPDGSEEDMAFSEEDVKAVASAVADSVKEAITASLAENNNALLAGFKDGFASLVEAMKPVAPVVAEAEVPEVVAPEVVAEVTAEEEDDAPTGEITSTQAAELDGNEVTEDEEEPELVAAGARVDFGGSTRATAGGLGSRTYDTSTPEGKALYLADVAAQRNKVQRVPVGAIASYGMDGQPATFAADKVAAFLSIFERPAKRS